MPYLYIDSTKRINRYNTNSNDFIINFNENIIIKEYIKLLWCIISKTIYLINKLNNILRITFNDNTTKLILIDYNNYSPEDLALYIKNSVNYANFNMLFDSNKFIFTLSANQPFTLDFTLSNFSYLFNMEKKIYNSVNNEFKTNILNFNEPLNVFIDIVEIEGIYINNNGLNANFIINMDVERMGVLSYFNRKNYEQINYIDNNFYMNLNKMRIRILDNDNNLIDNNNSEIYIILEYK